MSGAATPRGDEPGRLSGARGEFVSSLPRRLELLRTSLDALEQSPGDSERLNGLLRRIHALGSSARVLGFASVAEALSEAERGLRGALSGGRPLPLGDVARAFDLLPSLLSGAQAEGGGGERQAFPISVLVFGPQGVADAIAEGDGVSVECERTEDATRARELARIIGPDVAVVDADRRGARELVELFVNDPLIEPVPVLVVGSFATPDAATPFVELGAGRVLPKPVSPEVLRKTVDELRQLATRPRAPRAPLGELTVTALSERMADEFRRGLVEAVEGGSMSFPVAFGEGADVMAAVWGAVARVRELVTLRSQGAVRFQPTGPEGAVPLTPWSGEERRAGERLPKTSRGSDGVSIHGRRIVVADDDPAVVWFMTSLLKAVGAEVIEAHDGRRALEITREIWPDAVISDVLMPELDGFSLCHEIKRDIAVRDTPVILLSWKEDLLQRLRELGADADGYLRKEAAASAVVERVREVLRPRARVEQRIEAGGEVRGRLDGLTPRLLLELVCKHRRDARISVRDAVYLWELSLRDGRLLSITRSSAQGDFARGPRVLPGLLGVTAGRFVIEPDSTPTRGEFEGDLRSIVQEPIERARAALKAVAADALLRIKGLTFDREGFDPYLGCTPEPALGLLRRLFAAAGPRDLVLSGQADPRLLENVLSDLARRGVIVGVEREPSTSSMPPSSANVSASVAAPVAVAAKAKAAPAADEAELDWDDEGSEDEVALAARARRSVAPTANAVSEPVPVVPQTLTVTGSSGLPLNAEPTPAADWTVGPLFAFGGDDRGTLQGVGSLPSVRQRPEAKPAPSPAPAPAAPPRPAPTPEPRPVASPTPSPARAEGAEIANLMGLTETPAPAVAAPKAEPSPALAPAAAEPSPAPAPAAVEPSPAPAPAASPPSPAVSPAPAPAAARAEASPEPPAPSPAEPESPPSEPLAQPVESRTHSPFSEPPLVPSAPLTTDALLAALSPALPVAQPKPSEPPPSSSLTVGEGELIDSNNVQSVPPSEPPPEPEPEEEPERSRPPKKTAKKAEKAEKTKLEPKKAPPSEAPKKAESGGALRPLIVAALSFAGVYLVVKLVINPSAEVTPPPAASVALPAPPPKPTAEAIRVETKLPVPAELASETPPGAGWLQIEVPGSDPLYVDGTNIGRGPSRRMSLMPGKHQVEIGQAADAKKVEVDIGAAMLTRVSRSASPQPK